MREKSQIEAVAAFAGQQDYVLTRSQAKTCGMSDAWWRGGVGGRLVPLLRGTAFVICPGGPTRPGPRQHARSALLVAGDGAALCLGSALRVLEIEGTPYRDPEHVLVTEPGWHPRPGLVRHRFAVQVMDLTVHDGFPMTGAARSVFDAMRTYDRLHAVSVLDSARHRKRLTAGDLDRLRLGLGTERREWIELSDPKCESPLETRARLRMFVDNGLDWESQVPLTLPAYGNCRVDFLVGKRTVVECDGREEHDKIPARYVDRDREDALRKLGYEVVRVTWEDVMVNPARTFQRILDALARVG